VYTACATACSPHQPLSHETKLHVQPGCCPSYTHITLECTSFWCCALCLYGTRCLLPQQGSPLKAPTDAHRCLSLMEFAISNMSAAKDVFEKSAAESQYCWARLQPGTGSLGRAANKSVLPQSQCIHTAVGVWLLNINSCQQ
jgi:hypothetical protein